MGEMMVLGNGQNFVHGVEFTESFWRVPLSEIWSVFGEFSKKYLVLYGEWSAEKMYGESKSLLEISVEVSNNSTRLFCKIVA